MGILGEVICCENIGGMARCDFLATTTVVLSIQIDIVEVTLASHLCRVLGMSISNSFTISDIKVAFDGIRVTMGYGNMQ